MLSEALPWLMGSPIPIFFIFLPFLFKGILIPKGAFQAGFFHYPRQQDCAVSVMQQMEFNRVIPDKEFGQQLLEIFGRRSDPVS